jgi:hypothetical protein
MLSAMFGEVESAAVEVAEALDLALWVVEVVSEQQDCDAKYVRARCR